MEIIKYSRLLSKLDIDKMSKLDKICKDNSIDITSRIAQAQLHKADMWWSQNINSWCIHNKRVRKCDECYDAFVKALFDLRDLEIDIS
jgi:hypothetical protein